MRRSSPTGAEIYRSRTSSLWLLQQQSHSKCPSRTGAHNVGTMLRCSEVNYVWRMAGPTSAGSPARKSTEEDVSLEQGSRGIITIGA